MSARSVHDNNLYAYAVHCERRRIVLHTEFLGNGAEEYTDVTFSNVVAHYFEDVLADNILFSVEEIETEHIVMEWAAELFAARKNYGWPDMIDYADPQDLIAILKQRGVKGWEISTSLGLSGWVLAAAMDVTPRAAKMDP